MPTQQKYQWGFVYEAVGVGLSRTEFLLTETLDQAHRGAFYRPISRGDPAARPVLIQDGAGFHRRDGDPGLPDHVRVVTRPAYSPELNPIEGLWAPIKNTLCHRVFDPLAEREAVLQTELQRFWQDARRRHSLVFDWLLAQANTSSGPVILLYERSWYESIIPAYSASFGVIYP